MSDSQINQVIAQVSYQYSLNPSVTLSVVGSGGNLGGYTDTRKTAGAYSTRVDRYPTEAQTAEPGTSTVTYARVSQSVASPSAPVDTNNLAFPAYNAGGHIRAMTATDVYDTFIYPAIDNLTSGSTGTAQGGTYTVSSSTSLAGATLISGTPIFSDTRANTGAYTAGGIPETLDQPTTITNYYLHRINGASSSFTAPIYIRSDYNIQVFTNAAFNTQMQTFVRYAAASLTGTRIRYSINGTGTNRGSGMANTILNGSGNYQTRFVNANDYRAQEFPNGSVTTTATHRLRIYQT